MSLITTCPQCQTAFVVKPEQLAAHRGDVRCGKCDQSFNALEHLAEILPVDDPSSVGELPPTPALIAAETVIEIHTAPAKDTVEESTSVNPALDASIVETPPESEQASLDSSAEAYFSEQAPETLSEITSAPEMPSPDTSEATIEPESLASASPHNDDLASQVSPATDIVSTLPEAPATESLTDMPVAVQAMPAPLMIETTSAQPTFLHSPAGKQGSSLRWVWWLFSLLLIVITMFQVTYFLRTELSVSAPQLKPLLSRMCDITGCTIALPRKIEMISIDDSDLQEDPEHEGVVLLTATLINHARYAQAFPKLELTLTDTEDRAILRKLMRPQEYLPAGMPFAAGIPADGEVHVKLPLQTHDIKAAGYRVFITY